MNVASLSISDLLVQTRARSLFVDVVGARLRCGPSRLLTDELRAGLREHKTKMLPQLRAWGNETGLHVLWLLYEAVPPLEPFMLDQARLITNPGLFFVRLFLDIQRGPEGARARTGALQHDLRLLYQCFHGQRR